MLDSTRGTTPRVGLKDRKNTDALGNYGVVDVVTLTAKQNRASGDRGDMRHGLRWTRTMDENDGRDGHNIVVQNRNRRRVSPTYRGNELLSVT